MDPNAPQFTPAQSPTLASTQATTPKRDPKLTWGLISLIGPTALIVVSLLLYALVNFIASSTAVPAANGELFAAPSVGTKIANIILFLVGAISVTTWLPGIVIGIILLTTRKKYHAEDQPQSR